MQVLPHDIAFKIGYIPYLPITSTNYEFIWGPAGNDRFTIKSASFFQSQNIHAHSKSKLLMQMWSLPTPPKVKIFSLQLIIKRIRTRDQIYTNDYIDRSCPFCNDAVDNIDHIFMECSHSRQIWTLFSSTLNPLHWNSSFIG